jgi:hypothetical protein
MYNPSTWEAEAGGSPVGGQPGLHSDTMSPKKKKTKLFSILFKKFVVVVKVF